jgi:hypothetical protein
MLAACALSVILIPILDLSVGRWFQLLGVTLLTALTFMALNQQSLRSSNDPAGSPPSRCSCWLWSPA